MKVNRETGLIEGVNYAATKHYNYRPIASDLSLLVVHAISLPPGEFGGTDVIALFQGNLNLHAHPYYRQLEGVKVSAHCWIRRCGEIVQFVPFQYRAWHAGAARFAHRRNVNDFSIGIELEGTETSSFTDAQYTRLNELIQALREAYPSLLSAPVVAHSDVAPMRKNDPGLGFNWQKLNSEY
jgi:N-acetyl-anhydromuramoyl-L-alanine amidase